jgi:hypothetical protein
MIASCLSGVNCNGLDFFRRCGNDEDEEKDNDTANKTQNDRGLS